MAETSNCRSNGAPRLLTRRPSNSAVYRLIEESVNKPQSPIMPSPAGAGELKSILHRLEQMEMESRDLLQRLFSMVQTDVRLQRYIQKRLQDPKMSRIWELVEQVLASQGKLDIERMLNDDEGKSEDDNDCAVTDCHRGNLSSSDALLTSMDKSVKGRDDGVRMDRFKVRQFDMGQEAVAQSKLSTGKK